MTKNDLIKQLKELRVSEEGGALGIILWTFDAEELINFIIAKLDEAGYDWERDK